MGAENLAPLGFSPWIVHSVAIHYTNRAILAHMFIYIYSHILQKCWVIVGINTFTLMHIMNPAQAQQCNQNRAIYSGI
jgi:hypothetical protein